MTTSSARRGGLSYQAAAVIVAGIGMCGWVAHGALAGDAPAVPASLTAAGDPARAGGASPVYLTVPQADGPPTLVLLPPAGEGGAAPADLPQGGTVLSSPAAAAPVVQRVTPRGPASPAASGYPQVAPSDVLQVRVEAGPGESAGRQEAAAGRPGGQAGYQVLATDGSIVYIGPDGQLTANTGHTSSSGVVALGVDGSDLRSGRSTVRGDGAASHANGSLGLLTGSGGGRTAAVSGFEDHSVSVIGDDQIVTYDDSNVFVDRDGQINANTGDTDSSGLNAVDVVDSRVRAGNSGDAEGDGEDEEVEDEEAAEVEGATRAARSAGTGHATVTDEGASSATGPGALVIGADGYDDVSVRSRGDRNLVTYDDSNVVVGGTGGVNAQIGDSDTGGAVVMGIRGSDVRAGCEGDLCSSD